MAAKSLDSNWKKAIDRVFNRRSSKIYMPATLLLSLDIIEEQFEGIIPFSSVEARFDALVKKIDPLAVGKAWQPFFFLSHSEIWDLYLDGKPADFSDLNDGVPSSLSGLAKRANEAKVKKNLFRALGSSFQRDAVREYICELLLSDQAKETQDLVKFYRDLRSDNQAEEAITKAQQRNKVLKTLAECDRLGRDVFLKQYGYERATKFALRYNGKDYDSKAICNIALGLELSGGDPVIRRLENLGFEIVNISEPMLNPLPFKIGNVYERRKEIHQKFGGQEQGGISTPAKFPVVFLFTGKVAKSFGYEDGWIDENENIFRYTGEGQVGDMEFAAGNKAIKNHIEVGKLLLLFESLGKGKGCRFLGDFICSSWERIVKPDSLGMPRNAIVFHLVREAVGPHVEEEESQPGLNFSIEELRQRAIEAGKVVSVPTAKDASRNYYERSRHVKEYVLARAKGVCEACKQPAPFKKKDGSPYLEPHHIHRVSDGGPDNPFFVGAICPNCHRRIHSGIDGGRINRELLEYILSIEKSA